MMHATVEQAIAIAVGHFRAGRLAEAIAAFGQVAVLVPDSAEAQSNLGIALRKAGRTDEAIAAYRRAIALRPDHAAAHNNLGNVLREAGRRDEAIAALERAVTLEPAFAEAHNNRGVALHEAGRLDEAIAAFTRAIELRPDYTPAFNNLAGALADARRYDEALAAHHRAIELRPDSALAHDNRGRTLRLQGRFDAAIAAHQRAIAIDPDDAQNLTHLAITYREAGRPDEAIAACLHAIELDPQSAAAHGNLGSALNEAGRPAEAIAPLERALALKPDSAEVLNNLGVSLHAVGRRDEALVRFRRALEHRRDYTPAASNLLCHLHFHPDYDAQTILAEHRRWGRQFTEPLADQIRPHDNNRSPDRLLRVGLISPGFCNSQQGQLIQPLFCNHDRTQYRFIAYSDTRKPDAVSEELKSLVEEWHDTSRLSDQELSDLVRSHRIDILVDLALHLAGNRMPVFARKPAPIQVSAFEVIATTGLDTIDYRLTDPYLDPPGQTDGDYTEQSIRLPHCFWCYRPPREAPPVAPLPASKNGFITFGAFNSFLKFNRPTLALWARVLHAVPTARMIVHSASPAHREFTQNAFEAANVDSGRIDFTPTVSRGEYLRRHHHVDIGLDTQPYAGATTTMDALWMGVPVITLAGCTAVGRAGVSILTNLGLPDLVAHTPDQYVEIAARRAVDLAGVRKLRAGLRQQMLASPLMDGPRYARDVEAALRTMWRTWCGS